MTRPRLIALKVALLSLLLAAAPAAHAQTLEQMAGQMIVVGFQGDSVDDKSVVALRQQIAESKIGGVMFLKINVASLAAVKKMNEAFVAANPSLPPFITIDQEGGFVERLTKDVGFKEVPAAVEVAATMDAGAAEKVYETMAAAIADLGFTVNFGPVVDVELNPNNQVIAKFGRSFGESSDTVIKFAEAFVEAHHKAGVLTSLKHFPGHGSSTADSHDGFVDISKTWKKSELSPYQKMIQDDLADFVMIGHLYHDQYSGGGDQLPASLSKDWITGVLRNDLGFKGVVISDDLEMGAIRKRFDLKETVTRAVRAGMDVLLFSNTAKYRASLGDEIRAILVEEAKSDKTFEDRIWESYGRIVGLKEQLVAMQKGQRATTTTAAAPIVSVKEEDESLETRIRTRPGG